MRGIHPIQKQLLQLLRNGSDEGYTYAELAQKVGASSTSQIHHHLKQLERKGLLKRDMENPQVYRVIDEAEPEFSFLPLMALASCGHGIDHDSQHVIESVPVRSSFIPTKLEDSYLVIAEGDSMEPRIKPKDVVLVESFKAGLHNPLNKIVVCTYKDEIKMKHYTRLQHHGVLESFNEKYPPVVIENPDDLQIHGIVRGILFSKL